MEKESKKELEEKVEKLEKSNNIMKGLLIVLGVAVLLSACFGIGFIVGEKLSEKEEQEQELEKLTKDSPVVKNLFEIFREDNYAKSDVWDNTEYTDFEKKMFIAYLSIDENEFTTKKCGDLGATYAFDKTGFIFHCGLDFSEKAGKYYGDKNWEMFGKELVNNTTMTISADKLRAIYETIFGKDSTYKDENLSLNFNTFLYYDTNSKVYARFNCQCGGEIGDMSQVIDDITQDGTKLTIHTTFTDYEGNTKIDYNFEYEKETGNYIFVNRSEKEITVDDNEESKKDETENLEKLTKDSEVVKDLFNMFKIEDCDEYSFIKKVNTDMGVKKYFIYRSLAENEFVEKTCGSLNANRYGDGLFCAESNYYGSNWTKYDNDVKNKKVRTFDAKLFKEKYLKLYGSNASYKDENFDLLRGPIAYYDSKNNLYAIFNCWCGGACGNGYEHVIDDIEQDGYNLTINTKLTTYSGDAVDSVEDVKYLFKYESSTGNYVFVKTA